MKRNVLKYFEERCVFFLIHLQKRDYVFASFCCANIVRLAGLHNFEALFDFWGTNR